MKRITKLSFVLAALLGLSTAVFAQQPQVAAADPAATVAAIAPPTGLTVQPAAYPRLPTTLSGKWTWINVQNFNKEEQGEATIKILSQDDARNIAATYTQRMSGGGWAVARCFDWNDVPMMLAWESETEISATRQHPDGGCPVLKYKYQVKKEGERIVLEIKTKTLTARFN